MMKRTQKALFYLLVFLLPINLGKHFVVSESFVKSHLIDYLIPTLWVSDLLVLVIVVLWIFTGGLKKIFEFRYTKFLIIFVTTLLPSVAIASRVIPSTFSLLVLILHVLFTFYVASSIDVEKHFKNIVALLSAAVTLLAVLAFFQWGAQSSVFNNYLFFGEQPYNLSSRNVALISLFGVLKVPPYATFRHPNIFAGFLSVTLFWIYAYMLLNKQQLRYKLSFTLGLLALFLTFSEVAFLTLFLGIIFLLLIKKYGKPGVIMALLVTFVIFFSSLFLPVLSKVGIFQEEPSIYRRSNLQKSAYLMLDENALFGVGVNNFTARVEDYLPGSQILRFIQPVHNIFILIFAEGGVFALISFFVVLLLLMGVLLNENFGIPAVLFVTFLQFFILGSFDHYLLTIHQTQLLFWLTAGLALTYTKGDVEVQT